MSVWHEFSSGISWPRRTDERRRQLLAYFHMWHDGQPAEELLAGRWFGMLVCYLRHGDQVFETYWGSGRGAEAMAPSSSAHCHEGASAGTQ
jgi:hypothetical protein